jgi:hypothetical protein
MTPEDLAWSGLLRRLPEVVKKGGEVAVTRIETVPEGGELSLGKPAGDESGLAGAGWSGNPDDRLPCSLIQTLEQPFPRIEGG